MNKEKQLIAIAKACGWKNIFDYSGINRGITGIPPNRFAEEYDRTEVPDYLNDLNAMHSAELVLSDRQKKIYVARLHKFSNSIEIAAHHSAFAPATQRAETFLKTLNLWKE